MLIRRFFDQRLRDLVHQLVRDEASVHVRVDQDSDLNQHQQI
jgi:hypothetical protein